MKQNLMPTCYYRNKWRIISGKSYPLPLACQLSITEVSIVDMPRFSFRGTMLDTSRHYLTVEKILDHLVSQIFHPVYSSHG